MQIEVHPVTQDNVRDLLVLRNEFRTEIVALSGQTPQTQIADEKEQIMDFLQNPDYFVLMAKSVRGHPLGFITIFESLPYLPDKDGIISEIYVRDFYRRRKIGKKLLTNTIQLATEKKWRRLLITMPMDISFEAAKSFFAKQEFSGASLMKQWYVVQK